MVVDFGGAKICQGCFCHKQRGFKVGVKKACFLACYFTVCKTALFCKYIISKRNVYN